MSEPPDHHTYHDVTFTRQTVWLFANALRYYASALEQDIAAIQLDTELAKLVDEKQLRSFQISREIRVACDAAERFEKLLPHAESLGDAEMDITHGLVRRLKAVSLLYIAELERRRNQVATGRALTTYGVEILDTQLVSLREKLEMGVFARVEPILLVVSPAVAERPSHAGDEVTVISKSRFAGLELIDHELRERCLDLFNDFDETNQTHRFDTVVAEATRILEDRVRKTGAFAPELSGVELMTAAFKGNPAKLQLSNQTAEQEGAHLLFRGVVAFIRNPAHHRLERMERERVLQILGFVDYLLHLTEAASKSAA